MWYYKLSKTIKNSLRIVIYISINYIQRNSKTTYTKYSTTVENSNIRKNEFYFLENLDICNSCNISNKSNCDCLVLIDNFNFKIFFKN